MRFTSTVDAQSTRIRMIAANLTSGDDQSYHEPAFRIFQGLDPDIVLIQEFNVGTNTTDEINTFVSTCFGEGFEWYREPDGEQIPNGIISRWHIIAAGQWEDPYVSNRDFAWARIDVPGDKDLWAVSVHFLTTGSSDRNNEATTLVGYIQANVPSQDLLLIGGDLNTGSRTESAVITLGSIVLSGSPYPADQNGNSNTNALRDKPYDWVIPDSDLNAYKTSVIIGSSIYSNGLVFDSRVYTPLSEVVPVQYNDSAAPNMQHMAVVRDFILPYTDDDFSISPVIVNFGTVDADDSPFSDSSVLIRVYNPFILNSVVFSGTHPTEFTLTVPDLSSGNVNIINNQNLTFSWTPAANDNIPRNVTATFTTDAIPAEFNITLNGTPKSSTGGANLDIGNYKIEQQNSALSLTIPVGTEIEPNGFLVIGRNASQKDFETFWGTLGDNVVYINGMNIVGENGFPVINGDEQYRIFNNVTVQIDPTTGWLPVSPIYEGKSYQRNATNLDTFTVFDDPLTNGSPGEFAGTSARSGKLVLTEITDPSGSGAFVYEFIELFFDAIPVSEPIDAWCFY